MIGLPPTTPTAGIVFTVGAFFASIRVEQKQLIYFHKVLLKEETNWAKTTLLTLKEYNIGWAKQLHGLLEMWELEQDWDIIKQKTFPEWKRQVTAAAEKRNITRLKEECETSSRGEAKKKTKTMFVLDKLDLPNYKRGPDSFILSHDYILYTRALIMGRYGMLKCTNNFSCGYGTKMCDTCNVIDDESHRINHCGKWQGANLHGNNNKIDYGKIFSDDTSECLEIVKIILSLWDLENGKNEMRRIV